MGLSGRSLSGLLTSLLIFGTTLPVLARPEVLSTVTLQTVLQSSERSEKNRARDLYRHPAETLAFFGLRPKMTVIELWPGGGWYTEILAPLLAKKGHLIVTNFDPKSTDQDTATSVEKFNQKLAARPEVFGKVQVVTVNPPEQITLGQANSADMVLTFRNIHNWIIGGFESKVYAAAYRVLKKGGILGVEEHRAQPDTDAQKIANYGYVPEAYVIAAIEKAGFKFVGKSEINANPKDTKDYLGGVWTLPPTLSQGEKDQQKYLAIGESDRMTLKFVKP